MDDRPRFRLSIRCPDQHGIVARIANAIANTDGWITEAAQHTDAEAGWFFMRWVFSLPVDAEPALRERLDELALDLGMDWWLASADTRPRVVLMVSREPHCLSDLLARWSAGELEMEIPAILSNHRDLEPLAACHGIPFEHIPVPKEGREGAFAQLQQRLGELAPDAIVLARYMQILPPTLCDEYPERILNIHHSFLPSFVGARPYHQAFARGVKLIGATCHYVTEDLDAGPIIEQDVTRIRHDDGVQDLIRKGRDVERWVLARGLRYHLEGRVLTHGNKTIVFD
ncbi:formyltetrahydrofolate deformylase [Thioalkalivibrio sp. ALJ7]|uniref:formyltetrahydrofolate deformylase n=1 Tax=Thioalkalivibrio sp. ALJ7 TaxID=1158756 RepID=UPI000364FC65|nr:formyltetrahydrofolate deformylase [Thioalkalivibrio sp. ALJ7]